MIRQTAKNWLKNHPSVFNSYDTAWHVQNLIRTVYIEDMDVANEISREMRRLPYGYDKERGD